MQLGLPFAISTEPERPERYELPERPERPERLEYYFVRNHRARRYVLRVDLDGRVRVTIPRGGSRREADAFAQRQLAWILRQREKHVDRAVMPLEEKRRWRAIAKKVLPPRLYEIAARHDLTVSRVSIRDQRSRWGSCGRDGHICLNWRLVMMPDWVRDYVLIHELMHLRRMDHTPRYWRLVAEACPEYEEARKWLRQHGRTLR